MVELARSKRSLKSKGKPARKAKSGSGARKPKASTRTASAGSAAPPAAPAGEAPRVARDSYAEELQAEIARRSRRIYRLTTASGITAEKAAELQAAELKVCQSDVWYWLRNYAWFADPKADGPRGLRKIPALLWPQQNELTAFLLSGFDTAEDRTLLKSREIGATWLACALLYWLSAISDQRQGFTALAMSQKEKKVDDGTPNSIFGKFRFQHQMQPFYLRCPMVRDSKLMLEFKDGGILEGESTGRHAARGGRYAVVMSDEWAAVERNLQQPIVNALESVARSWWRISTPEGMGDDFHATVVHARAHSPGKLLEVNWRADPRRDDAWYASLLRENGGRLSWDERERNYNCSFAAISGTRIFKADRTKIVYDDAWLDANFPHARRNWPTCWPMDFGSGPSWTVCGGALVSWDHGKDMTMRDGSRVRLPLILLDRELVWQRVPVAQIASEILDARAQYPGLAWHFGDPAGSSAESDQESWQSNLNAAGVPIACLPGAYNTATMRDESIVEAQMMLDMDLFRVHEERCPLTLTALEVWEWDLPAGLKLEQISRAALKPRKDGWSHVGDACILYLVAALLRIGRAAFESAGMVSSALPLAAGAEISRMLDRSLRDRLANSGGEVLEDDVEGEDDPLGSVGIDWR